MQLTDGCSRTLQVSTIKVRSDTGVSRAACDTVDVPSSGCLGLRILPLVKPRPQCSCAQATDHGRKSRLWIPLPPTKPVTGRLESLRS